MMMIVPVLSLIFKELYRSCKPVKCTSLKRYAYQRLLQFFSISSKCCTQVSQMDFTTVKIQVNVPVFAQLPVCLGYH